MNTTDNTNINSRNDTSTKENVSNKHLNPTGVKTPNATTRKAISELEREKGKRFHNVEALMKDLGSGNS